MLCNRFFYEHRKNMYDVMASQLKFFIGSNQIKEFGYFVSSKDEGVPVVIASYFGVFEGVDMWPSYDKTDNG